MEFRPPQNLILIAAILFTLALAAPASAQTTPGALHGVVTDPSGAVVPRANVVVTAPGGKPLTATTNRQGAFAFEGLAAGKYTVVVTIKSFATYENDDVEITSGQTQNLAVALAIEAQQQQVTVTSEGPTVNVSPENNAGAIVISGKELDALSDDPDELLSDLQALAGPSAGPNGGQLYIDGFTAGQLPPKSSIREIRINQNPFSAEYDKIGYGRIEILTKPGTDKFHGHFEVQGNDSALNTKNPFAQGSIPGYDKVQYEGSLSGPLSKKASFTFTVQQRNINDLSIVDACVPGTGPTGVCNSPSSLVPFSASVPNRLTRTNIGPRLDYQLTPTNTLTVRYQYYRDNEINQGIGGRTLPSQAYNALSTEQTLQVSDTQILSPHVVNETNFQYIRDVSSQTPQTALLNPASCPATGPTLVLSGEFSCGGNYQGNTADTQNHYEFQNYTSWALGKHFLKFGARLRDVNDQNRSASGFNGQYTFPSIAAYLAGTPNQFALTAGIPNAHVNLFDAGLYVQDDWRVKPNITLSGGLRFETQNHISNHADWAPRVAIAWGLGHGKAPKTVLRAGWGIFYDRFQESNVLEEDRLNGVIQTEYVLPSAQAPDCYPNLSAPACVSDLSMPSASTIYQIPKILHAPYTMQTALTLERQLTKISTLSVTYLNSRGVHQLLSNSINTPDPYRLGDPRMFPAEGNIYQYQSDGVFEQNQLIININVRAGARLALFGYYVLNYANSDTSGVNSFQSNPFDLAQDYGRASFDTRNRVFFGGSVLLPHAVRISPFLIASSGRPFNVTVPTDLIGSTILNQRPTLVSTAVCSPVQITGNIYCTPLGTFNAMPPPGSTPIPINDFTGPNYFSLNLRISKSFGFGKPAEGAGGRPAGGGGGGEGRRAPGGNIWGGGGAPGIGSGNDTNHPYSVILSINARNIFNNVNVAPPIGNLSLGTGQFIGLAGGGGGGPGGGGGGPSGASNRLIYLQASFDF
ncbi:MAG: carboxypeptidase regulatory-like domain-containing protein [Candidatus Acidiferrales bacterium]